MRYDLLWKDCRTVSSDTSDTVHVHTWVFGKAGTCEKKAVRFEFGEEVDGKSPVVHLARLFVIVISFIFLLFLSPLSVLDTFDTFASYWYLLRWP